MDEDPFLVRIDRYRELLHGDLPLSMRSTLEWLLVSAIREVTGVDREAGPEDHFPAPEIVAVATEALEDATRVMGAQFGNVQMYVPTQNTLVQLAHRNFDPEFVDLFACQTPNAQTACSRSLAKQDRVVIEDVERDELLGEQAQVALAAGFRSVVATPLKKASGKVIGVLSTHFANPRQFADEELAALDERARHLCSELVKAGV